MQKNLKSTTKFDIFCFDSFVVCHFNQKFIRPSIFRVMYLNGILDVTFDGVSDLLIADDLNLILKLIFNFVLKVRYRVIIKTVL